MKRRVRSYLAVAIACAGGIGVLAFAFNSSFGSSRTDFTSDDKTVLKAQDVMESINGKQIQRKDYEVFAAGQRLIATLNGQAAPSDSQILHPKLYQTALSVGKLRQHFIEQFSAEHNATTTANSNVSASSAQANQAWNQYGETLLKQATVLANK